MPIIFSTIPTLIPASRPDQTRVFFQAPDDALLASVVAEVASILGRHQEPEAAADCQRRGLHRRQGRLVPCSRREN